MSVVPAPADEVTAEHRPNTKVSAIVWVWGFAVFLPKRLESSLKADQAHLMSNGKRDLS